jgi:hypothetical protein
LLCLVILSFNFRRNTKTINIYGTMNEILIVVVLRRIIRESIKMYIKWMSRDLYKGVYNKVNNYEKVKQ